MINIHTSRVFIPFPTGFNRTGRTFGINVRGYDENRYNIQRASGNFEDYSEMRDFYNVISAHYDMDLSRAPSVVPFVKYIDFMRQRGGGISATDKDAIEQLKKQCNTLIITDDTERDYIEELYLNILRRDMGLFEFKPAVVPPRFQQKVR